MLCAPGFTRCPNRMEAATTSYLKPKVGVRSSDCLHCVQSAVYSYLPFHHYGHVVICCWDSEFLTRTHRAETSFSYAADSFFRDCAMCVQYSVLLAFIIASDKLVCLRAEWIRVCEWRATSRWHKRHTKNTKIRKLVMRRKLVSCGKTNKMECYNSYERRRCL